MAEKNDIDLLEKNIGKFLEVYNILSPPAKAAFESQLAGAIKDKDEKTKKLYLALLRAGKVGMGVKETIEEMEKVRREG